MLNLLSVDNIAFTIFGYPMSYIEFIGTILYLWSVWLISKKNMLTWPIGIVSVCLYLGLFYQIRLYSDALEQVYYLVASVYGWWWWRRSAADEVQDKSLDFSYRSKQRLILAVSITLVVSLIIGMLMSRIHILIPAFFPRRHLFRMWMLSRRSCVLQHCGLWHKSALKVGTIGSVLM